MQSPLNIIFYRNRHVQKTHARACFFIMFCFFFTHLAMHRTIPLYTGCFLYGFLLLCTLYANRPQRAAFLYTAKEDS